MGELTNDTISEIPKILIVDDNDKNLFSMQTILQTLNAELFFAASGNEALSSIIRNDFCLILLDVQMPDMDGFEVAELIRNNQKTAHIPIIFVTAISKEKQHVSRGYDAGAVDYLFKPVNPTILKSKVKVFLELTHKQRLEDLVDQLQDSHRKLKESTQSMIHNEKMSTMGVFAAGIAHELNNPMMAMLNFVNYCIKNTDENSKTFNVLQDTKVEINRCSDIVKNLLSFTRTETGINAAYEKIDLTDMLDRVLMLLGFRIRQCNISFKKDYQEKQLFFTANINSIIQVFINLIGNAIDAIEANNNKEIRIDAVVNNGNINISIADNGVGIDEDNIHKIFEFFFTTKPPSKGTGLGLPICKKIIEDHGGKLICESEANIGTTFIVSLPIENKGDDSYG